ncbi:MAG TPA: hypothetical protein PK304_00755, partial [Mobilitalea sp.]|nr:hypothetical protein [Mobilitalea sp.]
WWFMIDWHWEVFFYYKLKIWGCELTVSQTPTFIIEPFFNAALVFAKVQLSYVFLSMQIIIFCKNILLNRIM